MLELSSLMGLSRSHSIEPYECPMTTSSIRYLNLSVRSRSTMSTHSVRDYQPILWSVLGFSFRCGKEVIPNTRPCPAESNSQTEAMWFQFENTSLNSKYAIRINVGKVNAISGLPIHEVAGRQDYVVVPRQPWLDGIAVEPGVVRQFVAMPCKFLCQRNIISGR